MSVFLSTVSLPSTFGIRCQMRHQEDSTVTETEVDMDQRPRTTDALSNEDNASTGSHDSPDWSPTEKESKVFVGVRTNSTFSSKSISTMRSNSIAPVQRVLSAVLDEPIGPYRSSEPRPWRARFLRFGPIAGLISMLIALSSIFVSFGILAGSRGEAVEAWRTTPPTLLAICTAVANLAMRYASIQGVIIAWWTRALRGSTVKRLHEDWRAGTSIRGALTSGNLGLLSIACLVSTIVTIDGPVSSPRSCPTTWTSCNVIRPQYFTDLLTCIASPKGEQCTTSANHQSIDRSQHNNISGTSERLLWGMAYRWTER